MERVYQRLLILVKIIYNNNSIRLQVRVDNVYEYTIEIEKSKQKE